MINKPYEAILKVLRKEALEARRRLGNTDRDMSDKSRQSLDRLLTTIEGCCRRLIIDEMKELSKVQQRYLGSNKVVVHDAGDETGNFELTGDGERYCYACLLAMRRDRQASDDNISLLFRSMERAMRKGWV